MDFNYINTETRDRETSFYENTEVLTASTLEHVNPSKSEIDQPEKDEGRYEQLHSERKITNGKDFQQDDTLRRIQILIYIYGGLLAVLYVTAIVLIIVVAVPKDGGWTSWGSWISCSESCGGGFQSRSRTCSNPIPSLHANNCDGSSIEVKACNRHPCTQQNVAFTAKDVYRNSSSDSTLLFQRTELNIANGYSNSTGQFTCKIPGVYHFVVTLTKAPKAGSLRTYLRINGNIGLHMRFKPEDDDNDAFGINMLTAAGTFHLDLNDVVDVYGVPNNFYDSDFSCFSGFLITLDQ
ncbi:uncharacterized protein LOC123541344 [Mercenaria mercenaria]|uniref:uncharacterized protein LOC123541344 n=1 Tax=Mercenaria mercenaria TaxID=6596 RepID=UPI00234F82DA|nr:uncharacterized protein LOC123541344 [Mercenaria mercenaria]